MDQIYGIDVSKARLDLYELNAGVNSQVENTNKGLCELMTRLINSNVQLVVFEATGAYHRALESALARAQIPYSKVNPRQARRFAEASGRLAKTDRVDAQMLAKMGAALKLEPSKPQPEILNVLKELSTARRALVRDQVAVAARKKTACHPVIARQLAARLKQIKKHMDEIGNEIEGLVQSRSEMAEKVNILTSIPGIAKTTAYVLLIDMPELGETTGKQAASLAGVAPVSRQSGAWKGREHIRGGRAALRRSIYMPTLAAIRHNQILKARYEYLIANGKPAKVAIIACMRKLLVIANALLRDNRTWQSETP